MLGDFIIMPSGKSSWDGFDLEGKRYYALLDQDVQDVQFRRNK